MTSLLKEIRRQPRHIREIMFAFCVVITVSLVGLVWFRSFEETLFVMMNPDPAKQEKFFAQRKENTPTLFASIQTSYNGLKAVISDMLLFDNDGANEEGESIKSKNKTYLLPLPGKR